MSVIVGIIAVISAIVPKSVAETQWACISAMGCIAIYLFVFGVRGNATSGTPKRRKHLQCSNESEPSDTLSLKVEYSEVGSSPFPRFVVFSKIAERTGKFRSIPASSPILEGPTPESIIRCLELYEGNEASFGRDKTPLVTWGLSVIGSKQLPFASTDLDDYRPIEKTIQEVLDQVQLQRNVISEVLGIVGGIFVAVVGVGVGTAHLKRGGEFSIFSLVLFAIIGVIALWFVHLGLSFHLRVSSSLAIFKIQRFGIFGFHTFATIPKTVDGIWLFINSARLPQFVLISEGNEYSSVSFNSG
jgi:hypothetical protein